MVLQFAVFLAILMQLILSGVSSCGCFGSKVTIAPQTMFAIDAACLLAILATRPWKTLGDRDRKPSLAIPLLATVASFLAPFLLIESAPEEVVAQREHRDR